MHAAAAGGPFGRTGTPQTSTAATPKSSASTPGSGSSDSGSGSGGIGALSSFSSAAWMQSLMASLDTLTALRGPAYASVMLKARQVLVCAGAEDEGRGGAHAEYCKKPYNISSITPNEGGF